jgi:hypothetical protein
MKTAYNRFFNNDICLLTFLSENYKIVLNKNKYTEKQFIEKIIFNKRILKNYLSNNNIKLKIIIKDISNDYFYKAIFILCK